MAMSFGVSVPNFGVHASRKAIVDVAQAADELGYDVIWVAERLLVPEPPNQDWSQVDPNAYEPLLTLGFLAGLTQRVKLGTSILIAPFRNPLVLARQTAALDQFSQGRLILGLGLGWMDEEFAATGVPMSQRGARTDEMITLLRQVWTNSRPSFSGRFTQFGESHIEPKPVQAHMPIWIGGNSDAALRRVARLGDGWTPTGLDDQQLVERIEFLRQAVAEQQRPLDEIVVSCNTVFNGAAAVGRTIEALRNYQNLGVSHFHPSFNFDAVDELIDQMKVFAVEVMPEVSDQ